jgi:hypothetical protein
MAVVPSRSHTADAKDRTLSRRVRSSVSTPGGPSRRAPSSTLVFGDATIRCTATLPSPDVPPVIRLIVGIGEVADITGAPQRQIRYWQDKGIIQAIVSGDSSTRRYDYLNIKKILLVKQLLDEGYTLDAAAAKVAKYTEMVQAALAKLKERKR